MKKISNPFLAGKYVSPDYFCDRQNGISSEYDLSSQKRKQH
jgi:hypothetical protein